MVTIIDGLWHISSEARAVRYLTGKKKKCIFASQLFCGSRDVTVFTDPYVIRTKIRSIISDSVKMLFGTPGSHKVGF